MRIWLSLLLITLAGPLAAQTAVMRSGDHPDFTRLTLPLPADTSFALAQVPGRAVLTLDGSLQEVDTGQVFDRISRVRLADISAGPGPVVALNLACDCTVEARLAANRLLVIDIRNGPPLAGPPAPATAPATGPAPGPEVQPAAATADPATRSVPAGRPTAIPAPLFLRGITLSLGLPPVDPRAPGPVSLPGAPPPLAATPMLQVDLPATPMPAKSRPATAATPVQPPSPQSASAAQPGAAILPPVTLPGAPPARHAAETVVTALPGVPTEAEARLTSELERNLLAALGSAATEGLLEADASNAALLEEEQRRLAAAHQDGVHPDPGLAATPSTFDNEDPNSSGRIVLSGNPCALHMAPLTAEEGAPPFAEALSDLRARLTGEFDRDDVQAYHDLAHFYLLNGFGPEAGRVLESVQQPPQEAAEMASAARILEFGHDPEPSPFDDQLTCDTDAALWAVLASERIAPGLNFDGPAIKRTLMTMPDVLKTALGPELAERFLAAGEKDFARDIMRIVERNLIDTTPREALAAAMLADGDQPPDRETYHELIAQNTDVSPEALLHYTNGTLDHGAPVDPETIGLLESYRSQYRDGPMNADLARAEVIAQSASGNFPAAFGLYDQEREKFSAAVRQEIVNGLTRNLADHSADAVFTRLYFTHAAEMAELASVEAMNHVADRLLGLGLAEVADAALAAPAEGEAGRERRLLRARAALEMNLPRRAEAELDGIDGPEADRLRAEASLATANYAQAATLFAGAGDSGQAQDASWLARDFRAMTTDAQPERAQLADVLTSQPPVALPEVGPPTLAASRDVLSQSGQTLDALRALLSSVPVDPAPDQ